LENKKVTEKVQKLKSEREGALKQVKESALTIQRIQNMVGIPGDVWLKAKMFDGELAKAGHLSGSKMVGFIMEQGGKLEATLRAMKALIASFAEMFPSLLESSESGETSSTYEDLTPEDLMEIEGAQGEEEVQKVESVETVGEIPSATDPTVSTTQVVDLSATPASSTVVKQPLGASHVADASPLSPSATFQVVSRVSPRSPKKGGATTPLANTFPLLSKDSHLGTPLVAVSQEKVGGAGALLGSSGHDVEIMLPLAPPSSQDTKSRQEKKKLKKRVAKLKKRLVRE
jgi:hypothetical protein